MKKIDFGIEHAVILILIGIIALTGLEELLVVIKEVNILLALVVLIGISFIVMFISDRKGKK